MIIDGNSNQNKKWREQEVLNIKVNILPLQKYTFLPFYSPDSLKEKIQW